MGRSPSANALVVIAGGGTAGHVGPGLAIASALIARGVAREAIHYIGSERGIEATLVPAAGIPLTLLPGRGLQRKLTLANVSSIIGLMKACLRALVLMRRLRPRVIVALGGYASVPAALGAAVWRIPIVVAEQNAVPGAANRLVGRLARASAVSFEGTDLPRAVLTGNPVRDAVRGVERAPASPPVVLAFGGSLGARRINETVLALAEQWRSRDDIAFFHVIGERDWPALAERAQALGAQSGSHYRAVAYEHDLPARYATAALAVCRAGATTVAELAVVGLPAVLIPLPGAPGDHQSANARASARAGAAVVISDAECTPARLGHEIEALFAPGVLDAMAAAARRIARPDAAERVADLVVAHGKLFA